MPARASATHEASAPVKISSRSHWADHQWHLDGMRPGLRGYLLRIDWSFDLPDGSRFTDPQWAAWLEDTRRFLWSMRVDPPFGRPHARYSTLVASFCKLRILIRWMIAERMHSFGDLDCDAAERFLRALAARPSRSRGGTLIGANLPNWILIRPFSWRLAEMALNISRSGAQCRYVGLGGNRVDKRLDDHTQQAPNAIFYAASRRGESPRWAAMSGSVNSASRRLQRMCALALLGSWPGGRARPTPLLRCLKAISIRHRNR